MRIRSAGWIAGSILLGAALLVPAAALAVDGNQTNVNSETWTGNVSCSGAPDGGNFTVTKDEVVWVFVHASTNATSGTLTASFAGAGQVTAESYIQGGIKYFIRTSRPETLLSFSDTIGDGVLTLSHLCKTADPTPTPTPTPTATATPTSTATEPVVTPTPTATVSFEAETGTPRVTPPPTDVTGGSSTGSGLGIALLALGGLAALALVATPARRRNR